MLFYNKPIRHELEDIYLSNRQQAVSKVRNM